MTMAPITDELRAKFKLTPSQKGVLITEVQPQGVASQHGVNPGDVVIQIADKPINSAENLDQAVAAARQAKRRALLVLFQQGDAVRWIGIPLVTNAN